MAMTKPTTASHRPEGTTRRQILMGLASASAAAAVGLPASGAIAQEEDQALLALADKLDGALQAHLDACAKVSNIAERWGPQWPTPDRKIYCYSNDSGKHRDILGWEIETPWAERRSDIMHVASIGTPEYYEASAERHRAEYNRKMATKSQRGAKSEKIWMERDAESAPIARAYWSEVERITAASGIKEAQAQEIETREALHKLVNSIVMHRESSITGLVIKAQAMQAWSKVERWDRICNVEGAVWADEIAATIIRQAASGQDDLPLHDNTGLA